MVVALLSACTSGGGQPSSQAVSARDGAPGPEQYCTAFYSRAAPLRRTYVGMSAPDQAQSPAALLTALGAPGQMAVVFDAMVSQAPDEIQAETAAVRDAMRKLQDNLSTGVSDPASAAVSNLLTAASSSPSFEAVGAYLQKHCPVGSPIALRYGATSPAQPGATPSSAPDTGSGAPAGVAPPVGTKLAAVSGAGGYSVVSGGSGFSVVKSLLGSMSVFDQRSTVTTYDASGLQLATFGDRSLTGDCSAEDVAAPGGQRIILTENISHTDAAGVTPESYSLTVDAWAADSGSRLWSTRVVPAQQEQISCDVSPDGGPTGLNNFGVTGDGRWGVYHSGAAIGSQLVDLLTGKVVYAGKTILRILGNDLVGDWYEYNDWPPVAVLAPPKLAKVGTLKEINPSGQLYAAANRWTGTGFDGAIVLGAGGRALFSAHDASDPLASGAERVHQWQLVSYALPSGAVRWRSPKGLQLSAVASGGGVLIATRDEQLVGVDEANGKELWKLPDGLVCGLTDSQFMLTLNGQVAVIDIRSGKQLSYSEGGCPDIRGGGIAVEQGDISPGVEHGVTVTQALRP